MKLYVFPPAPNAAKVLLYLAEKAAAGCPIEIERETINLIEGDQNSPRYKAISPFGTVPALETDAGTRLFESLAIIEYLEERFPEPSLFGPTVEDRAVGRQLERLVDLGVLIPVGRKIHASKSPLGFPPNPAVAEYYSSRLPRALDHLELLFEDDRLFIAGAAATVADCTLAAAFQFARFGEWDVIEDRPALRQWDERYREREAARSVLIF